MTVAVTTNSLLLTPSVRLYFIDHDGIEWLGYSRILQQLSQFNGFKVTKTHTITLTSHLSRLSQATIHIRRNIRDY